MNISFLNSSFLWFLPAIIIPVLLHLFFKKHPNKIEFSYLEFIKKALKETQSRFILRKYLLLLTRILIIAFLILFFARPIVYQGASEKKKSENRVIVFMFDVSYSMGYLAEGKSRIEINKEIAKRIINMFYEKSKFGVLSYSDKVEGMSHSITNDKAYLNSIIDKVKVTNRGTNIKIAWENINKMLKGVEKNRVNIILFSDLCRHGFSKDKLSGNYKIITIEPQNDKNNWINELAVSYSENEKLWEFSASVKNGNKTTSVSYFNKGKKIGSDLVGRKTYNRSFYYSNSALELTGRVELSKDNLNADNVRYYCSKRPKPIEILIVDGDPKTGGINSESYFLRNVFPESSLISEDELKETVLDKYDIVILANLRKYYSKIDRFAEGGGGVVIFPGDHYSKNFNSPSLPVIVGRKFTDYQKIKWIVEKDFYDISIGKEDFEWDKTLIKEGYIFEPKTNANVFALLSDGWPFLVEKNNIAVFCTTADRDWNNFAGRPFYAPIMKKLVGYLTRTKGFRASKDIVVGQDFVWDAVNNPYVETPDGKKEKPVIEGNKIRFTDTEKVGIYRLFSGKAEKTKFSVNVNTKYESNLDKLSLSELKEIFEDAKVFQMELNNWEKQLMAYLSGTEVSRYLILLILILIGFEIVLANMKIK